MEKFISLLRSKKLWTLLAAIVAALAAFFVTSCTVQARIQRNGVHIDTVRIDRVFKSNKSDNLIVWQKSESMSTPVIGRSMKLSGIYSSYASITPRIMESTLGVSDSPLPLRSPISLTPLCTSMFPISTVGMTIYSTPSLKCSSKSPEMFYGNLCFALSMLSVPLSRSRRKGGRRGRPRPGTKTIPLGGSHL